MRFFLPIILLSLLSSQAMAWWNEDWPYRLPIKIDTTATGANLVQTTTDAPVLIRLHSANFEDFFLLQESLSDVRFIAGDDQTPLSFHVESFDLINQLAFIWVQVPQVSGNLNAERIYMYYGNDTAVSAQNPAGSYDADHVAVFHFTDVSIQDSTAYATKINVPSDGVSSASLIAGGLSFPSSSPVLLADQPALGFDAAQGYSLSMWIKAQGVQNNVILAERKGSSASMALRIDGSSFYVQFTINGRVFETPKTAPLTLDTWQHLALVVDATGAIVFVNGVQVAGIDLPPSTLNGELSIGSDLGNAKAFNGLIDELVISRVARSSAYVELQAKSQGVGANLLNIAKAEQLGSAGGASSNYFITIFQNTGTEGWVVIILLTVMAVLSWIVMAFKAMFLGRVRKGNIAFMSEYQKLSNRDIASLDRDEEVKNESDADVLFGDGDTYQASALYHIYHQGIKEVQDRVEIAKGRTDVLNDNAVNAIRSGLEAYVTREIQALNRNMVLLTIAVSGGPFLGLLGTVLGVMITFAAIAASGDVNIAAIAPGVAAALLTTVFGLVVAIPALFGYNYLATRIKTMVVDMHVFTEEFVTKLAEQYSVK